VERVELGLHLMLVHHRVEELHLVDCVQHLVVSGAGEESLDSGHGELGVRLLRLHDNSHATIVEQADGLHHAEGLVQGAIVVMLGERVLLQEFVLDDLRGLLFNTENATLTMSLRCKQEFDVILTLRTAF